MEKFGVKFFAETSGPVDLAGAIPVFHRWIRLKRVPGLLIDVADYRHVPDGPGVMLIGHQADYALDSTEGPLGMLYAHKRGSEGSAPERLRAAIRNALKACRIYEQEAAAGGMTFRGETMRFVMNDRLGGVDVVAALESVLGELYPGQSCSVTEADSDPRDRRTLDVTVPEPVDVETLLERL